MVGGGALRPAGARVDHGRGADRTRPYGPLAAPLLELASTTAVKSAVRSGAGPAVRSSLAIAAELSSGQLRTIEVEGLDLTRRLRAVWPAGTRPAGPARDLLSITRSPRAEI
jgi:DNA-binding transcriptional LysR family regulator